MQKFRFGPFLGCIPHAKYDHTSKVFINLTTIFWEKDTLCTPTRYNVLYRVGVKKYAFRTQLDTMYRVGMHNVGYAYQLDTMYRVDV